MNTTAKSSQKESYRQQIADTPQLAERSILVLSGKGGVGKSTISMNLAYGLALRGMKTGLFDIDIHGPSIAKMAGIENRVLEGNGDKITPIRAIHNLWVISIANILENEDTPVIWRGPMKMKFINDIITQTRWPKLDYLIIDSPPGTGDEPLSIIQLIPKRLSAIIVTTPQSVAYTSVRKSIAFCRQLHVPILGIIENMSGFVCPYCKKNVEIFSSDNLKKTAKAFSLDVLGKIPLEKRISVSGDSGKAFVTEEHVTEASKEIHTIIEKIISSDLTKDRKLSRNTEKSKARQYPECPNRPVTPS
jgi:ATP-binding protein involved in chromosome partitioning